MMKIPETPANVGAYYGNEENGQWQANGVIYDGGVGGGVVGSGDAPRPMYPVHVSRHIPGYVMAGAYYGNPPYGAPPAGPPPPPHAAHTHTHAHTHTPDDFADYMWMENEEEFDKQVMQQLEEEALMEQCIEAMLEDEQRERRRPRHGKHNPSSNGAGPSLEETVSRSTLNPLAAEFVPTAIVAAKEEKPEPPPPEVSAADTHDTIDTRGTQETQETPAADPHTEETPTASVEEASPAPVVEKKDTKRDAKRPSKSQEPKKSKQPPATPQTCKSDSVVTTPAPRVAGGSEPALGDTDNTEEVTKAQTQPPQPEEPVSSGPKPINYAAAARANKPKPKTNTTTEKTPPPKQEKIVEKKIATKTEKPRKNSAK